MATTTTGYCLSTISQRHELIIGFFLFLFLSKLFGFLFFFVSLETNSVIVHFTSDTSASPIIPTIFHLKFSYIKILESSWSTIFLEFTNSFFNLLFLIKVFSPVDPTPIPYPSISNREWGDGRIESCTIARVTPWHRSKSGFSSGASRRKSDNPKTGSVCASLSFTMTRRLSTLSRERPLERRRSFTPTSDSAVRRATGRRGYGPAVLPPPSPLLCIIAREGTSKWWKTSIVPIEHAFPTSQPPFVSRPVSSF